MPVDYTIELTFNGNKIEVEVNNDRTLSISTYDPIAISAMRALLNHIAAITSFMDSNSATKFEIKKQS